MGNNRNFADTVHDRFNMNIVNNEMENSTAAYTTTSVNMTITNVQNGNTSNPTTKKLSIHP